MNENLLSEIDVCFDTEVLLSIGGNLRKSYIFFIIPNN